MLTARGSQLLFRHEVVRVVRPDAVFAAVPGQAEHDVLGEQRPVGQRGHSSAVMAAASTPTSSSRRA